MLGGKTTGSVEPTMIEFAMQEEQEPVDVVFLT